MQRKKEQDMTGMTVAGIAAVVALIIGVGIYSGKKVKNENGEEEEKFVYYTGYTVFNYEQTKAVNNVDNTKKVAVIDTPRLSIAS